MNFETAWGEGKFLVVVQGEPGQGEPRDSVQSPSEHRCDWGLWQQHVLHYQCPVRNWAWGGGLGSSWGVRTTQIHTCYSSFHFPSVILAQGLPPKAWRTIWKRCHLASIIIIACKQFTWISCSLPKPSRAWERGSTLPGPSQTETPAHMPSERNNSYRIPGEYQGNSPEWMGVWTQHIPGL